MWNRVTGRGREDERLKKGPTEADERVIQPFSPSPASPVGLF